VRKKCFFRAESPTEYSPGMWTPGL